MDPITQGALGSACAQAILHKKPARIVWLSGALAGMAPDLDILIRSHSEPLLSLQYHRHFTHSLMFIPVGALIMTLCLIIFPSFRNHWKLTFLASLIGIATHGLLDACTSYGTLLYWPFSSIRVSWDIVSIIDPMVTLPLLIGTALSVIFFKRIYVLLALLWLGLFFSFNVYQHHKAINIASKELSHIGPITQIRALPAFASSTLWRIIALNNQQTIYTGIAYTPLWQKDRFQQTGKFHRFQQDNLPREIQVSASLMHDFHIYQWFSDGWLVQAPAKNLTLVDARYLFGTPPTALWGISFDPSKPHIKKLRFIKLESKQ